MNTIKFEIRMRIAKLLLNWAFSIAPSDEKQGSILKTAITEYFDSCKEINKIITTSH